MALEVCTFGNNVATCTPYLLDTWIWNDTALAPHFHDTLNSVSDTCTHHLYHSGDREPNLIFPFKSSPDRPWDAWLGNCDSDTYCQKCPQGSSPCNMCLCPKPLAGETYSSTNQCFGNCLPNGKCDGPTSYPVEFNPPANTGNSSIGNPSAQDSVEAFTSLSHPGDCLAGRRVRIAKCARFVPMVLFKQKRAEIEDHATVLIPDEEFAADATNVNVKKKI